MRSKGGTASYIMARVRIQKALAQLGYGSRRYCEQLVREGRVNLFGVPVEIGQTLEPAEVECLVVDGDTVATKPRLLYLLLNKPEGYVTTVSDPQGRPTVMDLLPASSVRGERRVYPVGRLDRQTLGVLLFTNDGELAHALLHPSRGVDKRYRAVVDSVITPSQIDHLKRGPVLEDGPTRPPKSVKADGDVVELVIKEGRKRQVRRMLLEVGLRCRLLERLSFAGLTIKGLERGQHRALLDDEVQALRALCTLI